METTEKTIIGRAERIKIPTLGVFSHARIDTGAKTSSIGIQSANETDKGLEVVFFDGGNAHVFQHYDKVVIASSMGHKQVRYRVRLTIRIKSRRINTMFTLADRSTQVYPVLIGRNTLMKKFIVDVSKGSILKQAEQERSALLQSHVSEVHI